MDNMDKHELISALADGQLRGEELAAALATTGDPDTRGAWHAYHVIGDVLRSQDLAAATPADRFLARLRDSLQAQPVRFGEAAAVRPIEYAGRPAANDGRGWKLAAGFAAVTTVAAIGWSVLGGTQEQAAAPQLALGQAAPAAASAKPAVAPAPALVVAGGNPAGPMIRDARLDKLLAAHRQFGGSTALQTPAPFVRNAAFEAPAR